MDSNTWKIWIDTGGTFTDCIANHPSGKSLRIKVLSSSSLRGQIEKQVNETTAKISTKWNVSKNIFNGYHFSIPATGFSSLVSNYDVDNNIISISDPFPSKLPDLPEFEITAYEEAPVLAARLATEKSLNEILPPMEMRLGSTKGTNTLLERKGAKVALVVTKGFRDLITIGNQQRPDIFALEIKKSNPLYTAIVEAEERIDSSGKIMTPLSETEIHRIIEELEQQKPDAIAIAFLNSYTNAIHERQLKSAAEENGFKQVSISSEMANELKILPRAHTTIVNAYLQPVIENYLEAVKSKFSEGSLRVMTSYGGLVDSGLFTPKDSLLSGPAGGVVGATSIAKQLGEQKIITFDMGGTSTDVSKIDSNFDYAFETEIDSIPVFTPVLSIETVAAGGGSICDFDGFKLKVGPESAGSSPGPACYGAGGPLTITDVNYLLGRLNEDNFGIPINKKAAYDAFCSIKEKLPPEEEDEKLLLGFLKIANEKMADAIRKISLSKGHDPRDFSLLAFGGAGGQNACALADLLHMKKIIVPFDAGLLSAYGMGMAEIERISQKQLLSPLQNAEINLSEIIEKLEQQALELLEKEGFLFQDCYIKLRQAFMRFKGQEDTLEIAIDTPDNLGKLFRQKYEKLFGHWLENEPIEIESIKIVAAGKSDQSDFQQGKKAKFKPKHRKLSSTFLKNEWKNIPVYDWETMEEGAEIAGPALLLNNTSTLFVEDLWTAEVKAGKNVMLWRNKSDTGNENHEENEFAELELFTNRFKAVAANMGAILQRSSFSVNVKERLDFSCALLDPSGYLVANAPHIPVHLGSLGVCVRSVTKAYKLGKGDVIVTNHPGFGGSHLPDVTLISAVHDDDGQVLAYIANRAHHAELGGKTPGSMPPDARNLAEEGVVISPFYLVKKGDVRWKEMKSLLSQGAYPSRAIQENIADLHGALASIQAGIDEVLKLERKFGAAKVKFYMQKLQKYSSSCVAKVFEHATGKIATSEEFLDDDHRIAVDIRKAGEKIIFDFSGSSPTHPGNLNATEAILNSAIIYVLRLMIRENIPLNEGILNNVEIIAPQGSFINPKFDEDPEKCPAVVGGNTEVSQRIVDALIKALKLSACSQGTMNNLIFGNDKFGFYETICGGTGAGDGFHGTDAVHHHMTNTKITDPEVLEIRYPVRLEKMTIRENSGGKGKWRGGNGVIREITFLEDVKVSVLTQHRVVAPYGMTGGLPGKTGLQTIVKKDGAVRILKSIDGASINAGDKIVIETPGGGGWGSPSV